MGKKNAGGYWVYNPGVPEVPWQELAFLLPPNVQTVAQPDGPSPAIHNEFYRLKLKVLKAKARFLRVADMKEGSKYYRRLVEAGDKLDEAREEIRKFVRGSGYGWNYWKQLVRPEVYQELIK